MSFSAEQQQLLACSSLEVAMGIQHCPVQRACLELCIEQRLETWLCALCGVLSLLSLLT